MSSGLPPSGHKGLFAARRGRGNRRDLPPRSSSAAASRIMKASTSPQPPQQQGGTVGAQVILRVKRRREDPPVELLLLEAEASSSSSSSTTTKRSRRGIDGLTNWIASLNTNEESQEVASSGSDRGRKRRFAFKRVETIDAQEALHGGRPSILLPQPPLEEDDEKTMSSRRRREGGGGGGGGKSQSDYCEVGRFRSTSLHGRQPTTQASCSSQGSDDSSSTAAFSTNGGGRLPMYHLIDLAIRKPPPGSSPTTMSPRSMSNKESEEEATDKMTIEKKQQSQQAKRPHYIFRPVERELDDAIGAAMRAEPGAMEKVLDAIARGADVHHQRRNDDDTTGLMAAARRGHVAVVARLLRCGANIRQRDRWGRTALDLATEEGHAACEIMLRQALLVDMEENGEEEEIDGYVFDVYSLERPCPPSTSSSSTTMPREGQENQDKAPMVHVDGLAFVGGQGGGGKAEGENAYEETVLVFEDDGDWSDNDEVEEEDEDSNDEGYYANDYPEDEEEQEEVFSDDDEEGLGIGRRYAGALRIGGSDEEEEGDDDDEEDDEDLTQDINQRMQAATQRHLAESIFQYRGGGAAGMHGITAGGGGGGLLRGLNGRASGEGEIGDMSSDDGEYEVEEDDGEEGGGFGFGGGAKSGYKLGRGYQEVAYDSELDGERD